jgi:hypothetical protein
MRMIPNRVKFIYCHRPASIAVIIILWQAALWNVGIME